MKTYRKIIAFLLVCCLAVPAISGCSESDSIVVYTYADAFNPDVLAAFTQKTGIKIVEVNYTNLDEPVEKLDSGEADQYDVVILSDYVVDICRKKGLLGRLDKSEIPSIDLISSAYTTQFYDEENAYTVPYLAGAPLIVYNKDKVSAPITGYNSLLDPALKNQIIAMDADRVLMGMMLIGMKKSMNTEDRDTLAELDKVMKKLKPNIVTLDSDLPHEKMLSGDASVGLMFNSQVSALIRGRDNFVCVYPSEGMGFGIDSLTISKASKNKDGAYKFLEFCLDPEMSAKNSMYNGYSNCNKRASEYLDEAYNNDKAINIPPERLIGAEIIRPLDNDTLKVYERIWTDFKAQ